MERINFILPKYDWTVRVFMPVTSLNVTEIMSALKRSGCSQTQMRYAYELVTEAEFDSGLTYSNTAHRESVMVVGVASSAEEFFNTLVHEQTHLALHIAEAENMDVETEEFAYLMGDIARMLFPTSEPYLCEHCRDTALHKDNKATSRFAQRK